MPPITSPELPCDGLVKLASGVAAPFGAQHAIGSKPGEKFSRLGPAVPADRCAGGLIVVRGRRRRGGLEY
jgi:hypothetical protein